MPYSRRFVGIVGTLLGVSASSVASATYSIAATDSATKQVGGAVTSCVGSLDLAQVYGSVPGIGVIHAQAQLDTRLRGKNRALELIEQGVAPSEIIAMITTSAVDPSFTSRQYGVVDVEGRADGYTGSQAQTYKNDQQARVGTFTYSVQGNILTSQKVLDQAGGAFEASACDLADRLMAALEAGAENGEGDSRCTGGGIPSDAAFIEVNLPEQPAGSWLKLSVSDTGPESPLPKLRALFDTWRKGHPCTPATSPIVDAGADDAGSVDAGASGSSAMAGTGNSASGSGAAAGTGTAVAGRNAIAGRSGAGVSGSSGTGGSVGSSPAAISGSSGGSIAATPTASRDAGCSVNAGGQASGAFEGLVLLSVVAAYARSHRLRRRGRRRVGSRPPDRANGMRSLLILR